MSNCPSLSAVSYRPVVPYRVSTLGQFHGLSVLSPFSVPLPIRLLWSRASANDSGHKKFPYPRGSASSSGVSHWRIFLPSLQLVFAVGWWLVIIVLIVFLGALVVQAKFLPVKGSWYVQIFIVIDQASFPSSVQPLRKCITVVGPVNICVYVL